MIISVNLFEWKYISMWISYEQRDIDYPWVKEKWTKNVFQSAIIDNNEIFLGNARLCIFSCK